MGSSRFSMLLLLLSVWAVGSRAAFTLLGLAPNGLASGPLELLGALFVYYYREWWPTYRLRGSAGLDFVMRPVSRRPSPPH